MLTECFIISMYSFFLLHANELLISYRCKDHKLFQLSPLIYCVKYRDHFVVSVSEKILKFFSIYTYSYIKVNPIKAWPYSLDSWFESTLLECCLHLRFNFLWPKGVWEEDFSTLIPNVKNNPHCVPILPHHDHGLNKLQVCSSRSFFQTRWNSCLCVEKLQFTTLTDNLKTCVSVWIY